MDTSKQMSTLQVLQYIKAYQSRIGNTPLPLDLALVTRPAQDGTLEVKEFQPCMAFSTAPSQDVLGAPLHSLPLLERTGMT